MSLHFLVLFNHQLTEYQQQEIAQQYPGSRIILSPEEVRQLWAQIPAHNASINEVLKPVYTWISASAREGDLILIQGDFGATYLTVQFCKRMGLIPLYATSERLAKEVHNPDGTVSLSHTFRHVRFRLYGE